MSCNWASIYRDYEFAIHWVIWFQLLYICWWVWNHIADLWILWPIKAVIRYFPNHSSWMSEAGCPKKSMVWNLISPYFPHISIIYHSFWDTKPSQIFEVTRLLELGALSMSPALGDSGLGDWYGSVWKLGQIFVHTSFMDKPAWNWPGKRFWCQVRWLGLCPGREVGAGD